MSPSRRHLRTSRARNGALAASVLTGAILVGSAAVGAAPVQELGKQGPTPNAACPGKKGNAPYYERCLVEGQVTGFQRSVDGARGLFKARADGDIIAWSVDLGKPNSDDREAFESAAGTEQHGDGPTAGVGILKKVDGGKFRLKRRSPIVDVSRYYNERGTITLEEPLRIAKGEVVGLITPTWLPFLGVKQPGASRPLSERNTWVASRSEKNCQVPNRVPPEDRLEFFFDHTKPHIEVDTERRYGCAYTANRLLYWAYFVADD